MKSGYNPDALTRLVPAFARLHVHGPHAFKQLPRFARAYRNFGTWRRELVEFESYGSILHFCAYF